MNRTRWLRLLRRVTSSVYFNRKTLAVDAVSGMILLERDMREHLYIASGAAALCAAAFHAALERDGGINGETFLAYIEGEINSGGFVEKSEAQCGDMPPLENKMIPIPGVSWQMSKYTVLQGEFEGMMNYNPSYIKGVNFPVESVDWYEAVEYCNARSAAEGLPCAYRIHKTNTRPSVYPLGPNRELRDSDAVNPQWEVEWDAASAGYRLPTSEEWEYAASAGTTTGWYTGNYKTIHPGLANYNGMHIKPAGTYPPNPWGLYDMYGNVGEWCWDAFKDGSDPCYHIVHGGSYQHGSTTNSSGYTMIKSSARDGYSGPIGIRLARNT